nr:exonuclease domain-containing protein [Glaciecola sp. MH2013]
MKFVTGPCASLLDTDDLAFIEHFNALDKDSQCLIVRFINRKSIFIKPDSYDYSEIDDIQHRLHTLFEANWFIDVEVKHAHALVEHLTKDDIVGLLNELNELSEDTIKFTKSSPKATLIELLLASATNEEICDTSIAKSYWQGNFERPIQYFLYLYFGNFRSKLNQFSMRDLGVMRTRKEQAQVMARFTDIHSAKSSFNMHFMLHETRSDLCAFGNSAEQQLAKELFIKTKLNSLPKAIGSRAIEIELRLRFLLASELLSSDPHLALRLLSNIASPEAQEKWAREAYKHGHQDAVEQALEAMIEAPLSEDLLAFAEDFLARKYHKKRTSALTDMLRVNAKTIAIDEIHKGAVERGVVSFYEQSTAQAFRTENELWRALFGLYFWREIYELDGLGLSNEFEHVPSSLKTNEFYALAKEEIDQRLASTTSKKVLFQQLSQSAASHYGKANIVFRWRKNILERLNILIKYSELEAILSLLKAMAEDWRNLSDGFPDIMVLENGKLRFEEIKSEGDQLRRNQLLSIQKLQSLGFCVLITNVVWTFDPMQTYVVVDIETTGGRAQHHRITEIGMVKIEGGKELARWQSLINPQRRIPANITQLTGIDNQMVADAPLFADVADDIEAFTESCVFVAHNVNFDYGFIKAEFERLERRFRRPKLCTVREMRKWYKGISSYSLANLTKHFNIEMERHHRALSDAVAASELLALINEKRGAVK